MIYCSFYCNILFEINDRKTFSTFAGSFSIPMQSAAAFQLAFVGFIIILDIVDRGL